MIIGGLKNRKGPKSIRDLEIGKGQSVIFDPAIGRGLGTGKGRDINRNKEIINEQKY